MQTIRLEWLTLAVEHERHTVSVVGDITMPGFIKIDDIVYRFSDVARIATALGINESSADKEVVKREFIDDTVEIVE